MNEKIYEGWLLLMAAVEIPGINSYEDAVSFAETGRIRPSKATRTLAIEMYKEGYPHKEIIQTLGVKGDTLNRWIRRYKDDIRDTGRTTR